MAKRAANNDVRLKAVIDMAPSPPPPGGFVLGLDSVVDPVGVGAVLAVVPAVVPSELLLFSLSI